jgi:hypothetical protein
MRNVIKKIPTVSILYSAERDACAVSKANIDPEIF